MQSLHRLIHFVFAFALFTAAFAGEYRDPQRIFLTEQGQLTPEVIALLTLDHLYDPQDNLSAVVEKTQAKWHATRGADKQKERTDLVDTPEQAAMRPEAVHIANQMGLFDARDPSLAHYDYGICLGSFLNGVRSRLAHLVELWNQGIRFDELVFLTGERYLRKGPGDKDDYAELCDPSKSPLPFKKDWKPLPPEQVQYETEYDLVRLIWEQVELPADMAQALKGRVTFVNAPRGTEVRPSTKDTYIVWLDVYHPAPGSIVAPSDPLIWVYQQLTGDQILGPNFKLDTIAHAPPSFLFKRYEHGMTALIFDTVATCLYRIHEGQCFAPAAKP